MCFYEFHFVRGRKYVLKDEKRLIRREESLKYVSKGSSHFTLRVIKNEKFNEKGRNQCFFEQQIFVPTVELFEKTIHCSAVQWKVLLCIQWNTSCQTKVELMVVFNAKKFSFVKEVRMKIWKTFSWVWRTALNSRTETLKSFSPYYYDVLHKKLLSSSIFGRKIVNSILHSPY